MQASPSTLTAEQGAIDKITRRFVPLLIVCYFVSYLDKVNVGFAALSMNSALGITAAQFGFGAGIFFATYCIFEVPSNLALARFGARRWLARIMITWGIVSAGTAFITGATGFYVMRSILGACEAGFFPGIIYFLTLWFPPQYRARMIGYFMVAIPLSSLIGAPLSGLLLRLDAFGLHGWQWLFILEALPAIVLGVVLLIWLTDRPEQAKWLTDAERGWIASQMREEALRRDEAGVAPRGSMLTAFIDPRVLALVVVYFGTTALHQTMSFWLPQIVKGFGLSNTQTGFVTAIPYLTGAIGMVLFGRHSDRHAERKWHAAIALVLATAGFAASAVFDEPVARLTSFAVASLGVFGALPVFWSLPSAFLDQRKAAGGIAYINCLGSLSGLFAPWLIGVIRQETGSFQGGLLSVTGMSLIALLVLLALPLAHATPRGSMRPAPLHGK
ncbi:MAG TPA: MFS transporter [Bordetella sp.]|nr:MFS transporter [Bordetella sp.]